MRKVLRRSLAFWLALGVTSVIANDAGAFRMIQNNSVGRFTFGSAVPCSDAGGFAHWAVGNVAWWNDTGGQGATSGAATALRNAMASWNAVTGDPHTLTLAGTRSAGFVTDGFNVIRWGTGEGCSGGCLALTALVLVGGQVITEADVTFNNAAPWTTGGGDYDIEAVAAHELGHTLGIHHTDKNGGSPRRKPTMYASYFGINGRSLEGDDQQALQCSQNRYPVAIAAMAARGGERAFEAGTSRPAEAAALSSRPRPGGALFRYRVPMAGRVSLRVFDVAGRLVETLVDDERAAGEYEISWDGSSRSGRAPSGIYFARLSAERGFARATVILAE